jgi:hypothetical protein
LKLSANNQLAFRKPSQLNLGDVIIAQHGSPIEEDTLSTAFA